MWFPLSVFGLALPQQLSSLYYCSLRPRQSVTAPANIMIPSMNVQTLVRGELAGVAHSCFISCTQLKLAVGPGSFRV
jgi:hypothetical protein